MTEIRDTIVVLDETQIDGTTISQCIVEEIVQDEVVAVVLVTVAPVALVPVTVVPVALVPVTVVPVALVPVTVVSVALEPEAQGATHSPKENTEEEPKVEVPAADDAVTQDDTAKENTD